MDEKEFRDSRMVASTGNCDGIYPMYFGISCAFFALRLLSGPDKEGKWSELHDKMLQGSAQLLGLLVWRAQREEASGGGKNELLQKLENADRAIEELKRRRSEDAKANEKVVSIFAAQEQSWLSERKKLRQHIGALMNELRVLDKKKDVVISEFEEKSKATELLVESKDKLLGEEEQKRKILEEKLGKAEQVSEELRETAKREAQEHSTELWKHKTAFIELVSNQRQLEAEMNRAVRQAEATNQQLDKVIEQKEESALLAQNYPWKL